jgi:DNA (cytosine-5)-methyltransferase 1
MKQEESLHELALFAGAGGGILGGKLLGWRTVCAVEWEPYPASVLCARQNDGLLPPFPIWDDVQTFDGKPWRGIVDVVSGGFPCQDISAAGTRTGIDGKRSGLWKEMARIICEVRPKFVFVENSPMLTSRGLGRVLADLASMGFDARWGVLGAADVGANHQRNRIWIVAKWRGQLPHTQHNRIRRWEQQQQSIKKENEKMANPTIIRQQGQRQHEPPFNSTKDCNKETNYVESISTSDFWFIEPNVGRVANGVAARVDRLKAIGNGQVPLCAATAWRILNVA